MEQRRHARRGEIPEKTRRPAASSLNSRNFPIPAHRQRPGNFAHSSGNKLDSAVLCALVHQSVVHWLLLQLNARPENPPTNGIVRGTIPTCENPVTRPGIEPGSPWWEASSLTAQPLWLRILIGPIARRSVGRTCCDKWPLMRAAVTNNDGRRAGNGRRGLGAMGKLFFLPRPAEREIVICHHNGPRVEEGIVKEKGGGGSFPTAKRVRVCLEGMVGGTGTAEITSEKRRGKGDEAGGKRIQKARDLCAAHVQTIDLPFHDASGQEGPRYLRPLIYVSSQVLGRTDARLDHRGSKIDPKSNLRSTQKTVAPFEFRTGLEIEMRFISNRRNRQFEILIRDQQPSEKYAYFHDVIYYEPIAKFLSYLISISHFETKIDESEIQNHEVSLMQPFYIGTKNKLDSGSELESFDLGSGKMLVQPGINHRVLKKA
ncbi:hypothetical protein PR048_031184 [Dryococelus australis]|uniref:Uncharacterized protein n=1 Tax=Dryococelus australis TaxID=614101 RepID=A0ABQ9G4J7_9NEOP|nr:hypothetical protein PR048_031184 [Dryococelus australis]